MVEYGHAYSSFLFLFITKQKLSFRTTLMLRLSQIQGSLAIDLGRFGAIFDLKLPRTVSLLNIKNRDMAIRLGIAGRGD
jgi:hypothetical protein